MRLPRPHYASVAATLAIVLALVGPAYGGAKVLLTGDDIQDGTLTSRDIDNGTLTGRDVRNGSLTGRDVEDGSLVAADLDPALLASLRAAHRTTPLRGAKGIPGASGAIGPAGPGGAPAALPSQSATGTDVVAYADNAPIVQIELPAAGTWLMVGHMMVTNTGASGDYLNCRYEFNGAQTGAAGAQVDPGDTAAGNPVSVASLDAPGSVSLRCAGSGATTFDIAGITLTAIRLA